MTTSLKLMLFFWQVGFIDTLSLIQFCVNSGSQYGAIVAASAAGNFSNIGPKVLFLFEPIIGLGTSFQFIRTAQTAAEQKARIATLAAFLSTSVTSAVTTDPATNAAVGGAIASKISYMKEIIAIRGGSQQFLEYISTPSLKNYLMKNSSITVNPLVSPAQIQLQETNKQIINNMFQEHTANRYFQVCVQKIKTVVPLAPMSAASTTVNTIAVIRVTYFGVGLIGLVSFTILGSLYLFQRAERKRCQNRNEGVIIDVTASLSD